MTFDTEPEWMQRARQVPLRSSWESRQPVDRREMRRGEAPDRRINPPALPTK